MTHISSFLVLSHHLSRTRFINELSLCRTRRPSLSLSVSSGKRTLPPNELSTSNDSLWYVMCKSYRRQDEQVVVFSEYKCTQVFLGCKFLLGLETLYMVLVTLSTKPITSSVWQCVYLCLPVCMWLWIWVHYLVKRLHHHHMVWWPSLPSIWATWLNLNHGIAIA